MEQRQAPSQLQQQNEAATTQQTGQKQQAQNLGITPSTAQQQQQQMQPWQQQQQMQPWKQRPEQQQQQPLLLQFSSETPNNPPNAVNIENTSQPQSEIPLFLSTGIRSRRQIHTRHIRSLKIRNKVGTLPHLQN